jgi:hypothetical protein
MAWVVLEGLDRTGKSTVAELYKKQGFEVVHMSAPSKKYKEPGYSGPSYMDDILDQLMQYDNKDVIFDRSWYGELIWPYIYNRDPMLSEDDFEIIAEFEYRNDVERILMIDPNTSEHWARCVANKEPLNINQFKIAGTLFNKLAHKYGFAPKELKDFKNVETKDNKPASPLVKQEEPLKKGQTPVSVPVASSSVSATVQILQQEDELDKLEKANAIRDVLSKRILKQKGGTFDKLEDDLKTFLKSKLSEIFSDQSQRVSLSEDEITILKLYCQQLKEKVSKK